MQSAVSGTQHPKHGLLLKSTLLSTSTLTVMAGATISPSLPAMQEVFAHIPNVESLIPHVLTLPALFIAIGSPLAGLIIDRFGRRTLLLLAILLYGVAGGLGIIVPSLILLLVSRAFLGFGVAGIRTSGTTLIADYFSGAERAQMMGWQAAFAGFGGMVFLTASGYLAEIHWRGPFYIYLLSFVVFPFVYWMIYEPQAHKADKPAPHNLAVDPVHDSALDAKLPLRLMFFIYPVIALTQVVFYFVPVQLPFHVQTVLGASPSQTGRAIASTALFYALASMSFGWLVQRLGRIPLMIGGLTLTSIGYGLVGLATSWPLIIIGLMMGGWGLGVVIPNLNLWLADEVPLAVRGRALGGFTTALFFGQFLSPFVSQPLSEIVGIGRAFQLLGMALFVFVVVLFLFRQQIESLGSGVTE